MSQLNLIGIAASIKVVLTAMIIVMLSSCVEPEQNSKPSAAQGIYVGHGSVWGDGFELELSKTAGESSFFEDEDEKSFTPHGTGRRANLNIGIEEFVYAGNALHSLESRAFPESEIEERIMGDFTLGYDCEHKITDSTVLFIEWSYPNGKTLHAFYDMGCQNPVTQKLRDSYFEFVDKLRKGISKDQWFKSTSRNVAEATETE